MSFARWLLWVVLPQLPTTALGRQQVESKSVLGLAELLASGCAFSSGWAFCVLLLVQQAVHGTCARLSSPLVGSGKMCMGCPASNASMAAAVASPAAAAASRAACALRASSTTRSARGVCTTRHTPAAAICARIKTVKAPPTVACISLNRTHSRACQRAEPTALAALIGNAAAVWPILG